MTTCLVAIVKNESHVIERCLKSVIPYIDYWIIVDTGSKDDTREKIRTLLKDIPGELHEDEWVHFAHNRTLAIQRARGKADWLLMMDADHVWHGKLPDGLDADGYNIEHRYSGMVYHIPILMRGDKEWHYECPIHETIVGKDTGTFGYIVPGPYVTVFPEGARSKDPEKFEKDAAVLLKHVAQFPDDPRPTYYLAQSYLNAAERFVKESLPHKDTVAALEVERVKAEVAGEFDKAKQIAAAIGVEKMLIAVLEAKMRPLMEQARKWYARRTQMDNGWWEERWHARFRLAQTGEHLDLDFPTLLAEFLSAYQEHPGRAEPLVVLAKAARTRQFYSIATMCARQAMAIQKPSAGLFVESQYYDWLAHDEFSVSCFYQGDPQEGLKVARRLLISPTLPNHERPRVERNIKMLLDRLERKAA